MSTREQIELYLPQYISLDNEIKRLVSAETQYIQQQSIVHQLNSSLFEQQAELDKITAEATIQKKRVDKLKNKMNLKSIMAKLQNKYNEKLKREESEYYRIIDREHVARRKYNEINNQLNLCNQQLRVIEAEKRKLDSLKDAMNNLLDQIFANCQMEYPQLFQTSMQLRQLRQRIDELFRYMQSYESAEQSLVQAERLLASALRHLEASSAYATTDLFVDGSAHYMVDGMKYGNLNQARDDARAAVPLIQQAIQILPILSQRIFTNPHITQGNMFLDMVFDNVIVDLMIRQKIINSKNQVAATLRSVRDALAFINSGMKNDVKRDLEACRQQAHQIKGTLWNQRHAIMQEARRGGNPYYPLVNPNAPPTFVPVNPAPNRLYPDTSVPYETLVDLGDTFTNGSAPPPMQYNFDMTNHLYKI